jgi:hypothetical protein
MYRERGRAVPDRTADPAAGRPDHRLRVHLGELGEVDHRDVPQPSFLADTDTTYLDESLIADAVVWMFLRAKGLSYAEEMTTYERNLEQQPWRGTAAPRPGSLSPRRSTWSG